MPLVVPTEGEIQLLQKMLLLALSTNENYILKLYRVDHTPVSTDARGSYTEANFTNYAARTLTRASWAVPIINGGGAAESSYGTTPQSWTCGTTGRMLPQQFAKAA